MTLSPLDDLLSKADQLTLDEQLALIARLAEKARAARPATASKRKWREIAGTAPYPLAGEDAQAWVTRTRREGADHRSAPGQRAP